MRFETDKSNRETENKSVSKWLPLGGLAGLLILSEAVYLALLRLDAVNGWRPVLTFWCSMAALFVFYALAAILVRRFESIKKQAIWLIFIGAVVFRITLLPAGIPHDLTTSEKLEALRTDLRGAEVTYERFQLFDNDIWRYVWDGHVGAHGINPYLYAPVDVCLDALTGESGESEESIFNGDEEIIVEESEETAATQEAINETEKSPPTEGADSPDIDAVALPAEDLTDGREIWSDIRENVNHADVTTIYQPLAQFVFRLSHWFAPGSLLMMKILLVACELIGILFLALTLRRMDLPVTGVILYAWNPLMIKVFAGSGHADAILVAALCATAYFVVRGAKSFAAIAFGLAILAKLSPVFLLPFVARRVGWLRTLLIGAIVFVGYAPFLSAGGNLFAGFLKFAREWQFNAGAFALIRWIFENLSVAEPTDLARQVCGVLFLGIVVWLTLRDDLSGKTFVASAAILLGALVVLSPTVMPWYLSWVLPFAVLARQNVWFYFSALALTAFHILIDLNEYAFALWFEHGVFFALIFGQVWLRRRAIKTSLKTNLIPAIAVKNVSLN